MDSNAVYDEDDVYDDVLNDDHKVSCVYDVYVLPDDVDNVDDDDDVLGVFGVSKVIVPLQFIHQCLQFLVIQ